MVRLVKSLYGHPEAGGHWEKHLEKIVLEMGGKPVKEHPSCFWFPDHKLFMIIYVDDLWLNGPAGLHEEFWDKLGSEVKLEPAEDLDRYLGRHHTFTPFDRLSYNLIDYFTSPVEL